MVLLAGVEARLPRKYLQKGRGGTFFVVVVKQLTGKYYAREEEARPVR